MYAGAILVPIIVGTSLKFSPEEIAYLITVATAVNVHPKTIGSPVPVILFACKNVATPHIKISTVIKWIIVPIRYLSCDHCSILFLFS
jgi:xanthine permease